MISNRSDSVRAHAGDLRDDLRACVTYFISPRISPIQEHPNNAITKLKTFIYTNNLKLDLNKKHRSIN